MKLTIEQALQYGVTAHKEGNLQEAEKLYRSIIATQPHHPDANHNLGVLAVDAGKHEEALPLFKAALESNSNQGQYWLSYIHAFIKLGQLDNARSVLERGRSIGLNGDQVDQLEEQLDISPNVPSEMTVDHLLNIYKHGRLDEALKLGAKLGEQYPDDPNIPNIIGAVYSELGKYDDAISQYNNAIEIKSDFIEAYNNLGLLLNKLQRYEEAILSYQKAIELKSDFAEAYNNLGITYKELGRYEEAVISYSKSIELGLDFHANFNLGNALLELDQVEEAISSFEAAIELKPDYVDAYFNLANALHRIGSYESAVSNYERVIELKPNYPENYNNLGVSLFELSRLNDACFHFNKAIELRPAYAEAYNNLAICLNDIGCHEQAIQNYQQAIRRKKDYVEAWTNIFFPIFACKSIISSYTNYLPDIRNTSAFDLNKVYLSILKYKLQQWDINDGRSFEDTCKLVSSDPKLKIENPNKSKNITCSAVNFPEKVFALLHWGRSGTGLLHSLIDNHEEVSTLPSIYLSEFFHHSVWRELTEVGWDKLVDRFIAMYPVLFDARDPTPIKSTEGNYNANLGKKEGMANVGENRDEYLSLDRELFRIEMMDQLSHYEYLDANSFFKIIHIAYEKVLGNCLKKKSIFYHIHNPSVYSELNFINSFPQAKWIVMVREPLQSCESWICEPFESGDYKSVMTRILSMFSHLGKNCFQKQEAIGVRLEDLIKYPRRTIPALCDWMGVKESASLYEMTAQGKKWWGDTSSPDFGKEGQPAFSKRPIERKIGSVFSEDDQLVFQTLFYPFSRQFRYVEETEKEFKKNLRDIRPMLDQMFDFEKKIASKKKITNKCFMDSGSFLCLRSGLIDRWNTLDKTGSYPNMLKPLIVFNNVSG